MGTPGPSSQAQIDGFATRSGLEPELVGRLVDLGILPSADLLDSSHIPLARMSAELHTSGLSLDQLAEVVANHDVFLANINRGFVRDLGLQAGTFEDLASELGVSPALSAEIQMVLGVAGADGEPIRADDAATLRLVAEVVELGVAEDVAADVLQVVAENLRRVVRAFAEMWAVGVRDRLIESGMSYRDLVAAPDLNGERFQSIAGELISTIWRRFLDDEIFSGTVELLELALEEAGIERVTPTGPPAVAFVDLTAFTAMTDRDGDVAAASGARDLRALLTRQLVGTTGTLVKMLGDGAMLHFRDAHDAVHFAVGTVEAVSSAGLPAARFGISVGPVIFKDTDVFGQTVNLAARLVDYARPSEVLVSGDIAADPDAGLQFRDIGPVSLKGIEKPVHVFSASATPS